MYSHNDLKTGILQNSENKICMFAAIMADAPGKWKRQITVFSSFSTIVLYLKIQFRTSF